MTEPTLDIRPERWTIVRTILQKCVPEYEAWAFGSRVQGRARMHSDLDIAIITHEPLPFRVLAMLEEEFAESDLPWKVNVVDWDATSLSFRAIIERANVVVQPGVRVRSLVSSETQNDR